MNEQLDALARRYGRPRIDYFPSTAGASASWRIWFDGWHVHHNVGMYGDLTAHGRTLEQALERMNATLSTLKPRRGWCSKWCPEYSDGAY